MTGSGSQPQHVKQNNGETKKEQSMLPFSLPDLNKSTIYRRHEARLAKSYALREDPRPAVLRVMSGLPGFRMIVPPYQAPKSPSSEHSSTGEGVHASKQGALSESTMFTTSIDEMTSASWSAANNNTLQNQQQQPVVLQAAFATAVTAGMAEYLLGNGTSPKTPFGARGKTRYSPFATVTHSDSMAVQMQKHKHIPQVATRPSGRQIALAASSTSLLFGTKVYLEQQSLAQEGAASNNHPHILASAAAGAVVGISRQLLWILGTANAPKNTTMPPSALAAATAVQQPAMTMIPRHVLAATLYFSTYEQLLQSLSPTASSNGANSVSNLSVATAGAAAGGVHAAVLNGSRQQVFWLPAVLRAAPIHALIFLGYESMKANAAVGDGHQH